MKILVFGAGAIGTYVGGSLALQGQQAVFVERPEVAVIVAENGLEIQTADGVQHVVPRSAFQVAASLDEALQQGPFDISLFALKSFDTPGFIAGLSAGQRLAIGNVLCLSNGVDNETALAAALGAERVIAGTVTTAIGRPAVGDVIVEKLRGTGVAAAHPLARQLAAAMNEAGLNTRLYPHAAAMKWSKMLTNLLSNATSAILDMTPAEVFAHPGLYRLEVEQLREALRVMKALGIGVVDLPHTPVRLLAFGVSVLPAALARPFLQRAVGGGRGGKMPSFHIDLHAGRGQSEVDYLNGAVVRYGKQVGVPTPVNRLLNETLLALTAGKIPLDEYARRPEKLLY